MATKRVKSDETLTVVKDWKEADGFIRTIGDLQQQITKSEVGARVKIDKVKEALAADVKPRQAAIKRHVRSLEIFANINHWDFNAARSKKLNFGTLGWRKSAAIRIAQNTLELIKQVFGRKWKTLVHVRETVNKDALAKLTDEELAKVGARRKGKDAFFVEPFDVESADYNQ